MADAVKENGIVFQTGSQQRSEYGGKFRRTVEMVRSGAIGELKKIRVCVGAPPKPCDLPTEPTPEGIDSMKTGAGWVIGTSDLHSEDPAACPGAIRNAVHDLGSDCKILDLNNDLVDLEPVDCDFEFAISFGGCPAFAGPNSVHWIESIVLDGGWNSGEDIILDVDGNGFFN